MVESLDDIIDSKYIVFPPPNLFANFPKFIVEKIYYSERNNKYFLNPKWVFHDLDELVNTIAVIENRNYRLLQPNSTYGGRYSRKNKKSKLRMKRKSYKKL